MERIKSTLEEYTKLNTCLISEIVDNNDTLTITVIDLNGEVVCRLKRTKEGWKPDANHVAMRYEVTEAINYLRQLEEAEHEEAAGTKTIKGIRTKTEGEIAEVALEEGEIQEAVLEEPRVLEEGKDYEIIEVCSEGEEYDVINLKQ